jgi:hypothetical protein
MDKVRLGRVLGFGARQAMKTLVTAVDAATAESPPATRTSSVQSPRQSAAPSIARTPAAATMSKPAAARTASQPTAPVERGGILQGLRRAWAAIWSPVVRLSGVLWLEITGVLFGVLAFSELTAIIRLRPEWHAPGSRKTLVSAIALLLLFGYFCVTSFLRARRRERRR